MRPLGNRVLVKADPREEVSASGIILASDEKPLTGTVTAVGPGLPNLLGNVVAMTVRTGDRIIFGKYAGTSIKVGSEELLVLKEEEIIGILND